MAAKFELVSGDRYSQPDCMVQGSTTEGSYLSCFDILLLGIACTTSQSIISILVLDRLKPKLLRF